jgi:citrate synthase
MLSEVDGERGQLVIRGYSVERLVERATFEDVCALLWNGVWPSPAEQAAVRAALAKAEPRRSRCCRRSAAHSDAGRDGRSARGGGSSRSTDPASDRLRLTGAIPVFAAAWARQRLRQTPVPPRPLLSHAADCLQMLSGSVPAPAFVRALDAYWCCVAEHGMNASTFTARVVASTGSDTVSAIVAAIGALKGPLHGGAPGPVLDMLDALGTVSSIRAWLEAELAAGRRIMGMGHRIYHVRDPRAAALERAGLRARSQRCGGGAARAGAAWWNARPNGSWPNAIPIGSCARTSSSTRRCCLTAVGISRTLFSPMFAASRVAGWCGHIDEQRAVGRLIRPASIYVGPSAGVTRGMVIDASTGITEGV